MTIWSSWWSRVLICSVHISWHLNAARSPLNGRLEHSTCPDNFWSNNSFPCLHLSFASIFVQPFFPSSIFILPDMFALFSSIPNFVVRADWNVWNISFEVSAWNILNIILNTILKYFDYHLRSLGTRDLPSTAVISIEPFKLISNVEHENLFFIFG